MNKRLLIIGILLMLFAGTVQGQAHQRRYKFYGTGGKSCAEFVELPDNSVEHYVYDAWILGFVSSADLYSEKAIPPSDSGAILATAKLFCKQHPMMVVANAGEYVIQELLANNQ